jgi:hypothetical protein
VTDSLSGRLRLRRTWSASLPFPSTWSLTSGFLGDSGSSTSQTRDVSTLRSLLVGVDTMRRVGVRVTPGISAAGDYKEAYEERDGGDSEHGDGSAETCAYL